MPSKEKPLFGGDLKWNIEDWTDSDDRVRGGSSQSYLDVSSPNTARFYGNLDINTLGGAGFASQRTAQDNETWDVKDYDGIRLVVAKIDSKRYTITLKDRLLPKDPTNGREQSTISWEYDFKLPSSVIDAEGKKDHVLDIPWKEFKPTYRGKEKKDAEPLDLGGVKRFSFLMRSFFGDQKGDFSLTIKSLSAYESGKTASDKGLGFAEEKAFPYPYKDYDRIARSDGAAAVYDMGKQRPAQGILAQVFEYCTQCIRLR